MCIRDRLGVEEGVSKKYDGIEDSYNIGDKFQIRFLYQLFDERFENIPSGYYLSLVEFPIKNESRPLGVLSSAYEVKETEIDGFLYEAQTGIMYLSRNEFSLNALHGDFVASRYYKNDWQALFTNAMKDFSEVMSLNCFGVTDDYEKLLLKLEDFHKTFEKN